MRGTSSEIKKVKVGNKRGVCYEKAVDVLKRNRRKEFEYTLYRLKM